MNIVQVVVKTIATTIDVLVALVVLLDKRNPDHSKKAITILTIVNLMGVWI